MLSSTRCDIQGLCSDLPSTMDGPKINLQALWYQTLVGLSLGGVCAFQPSPPANSPLGHRRCLVSHCSVPVE